MNRLFLVCAVVTSLLLSCNDDDSNGTPDANPDQLVGKWLVVKEFSSTGGGIVENEVDSDKYYEFTADGAIRSNGDICTRQTETTAEGSSGTYHEADERILSDECETTQIFYTHEPPELTINYPCFEGCGVILEKIE